MARFVVVTLLMLGIATPSFGKALKDTYPVPCNNLWNAVKSTLGNPGDYAILTINDEQMTAYYTITGAERQRVNSVAVTEQDGACAMKVDAPYSGYGNDDAGLFKKRVGKALGKPGNAKPAEVAKPGEKK